MVHRLNLVIRSYGPIYLLMVHRLNGLHQNGREQRQIDHGLTTGSSEWTYPWVHRQISEFSRSTGPPLSRVGTTTSDRLHGLQSALIPLRGSETLDRHGIYLPHGSYLPYGSTETSWSASALPTSCPRPIYLLWVRPSTYLGSTAKLVPETSRSTYLMGPPLKLVYQNGSEQRLRSTGSLIHGFIRMAGNNDFVDLTPDLLG
ncbi:hypothetical protein FNV43_RR13016 [Rhamnella rubrinervis]|uniref:Uncharacterized protein n=1 Tax=Rhamnella rubrinervis TaxID=2594499 RepID=A0A8K0H0C4_9ROSA|nr:hypothetical protein FNV43_RR13016 [Rhamnella rubrinervis]